MLKHICKISAILMITSLLAQKASAQPGKEDYRTYCAACHGLDGKGNGTWSGAKVPDLSQLSRDNGGKFPVEEIHKVIDGRSQARWHQRQREMPYWGEVFSMENEPAGSKAKIEARINAIVNYIQVFQEK